VLTVAGHAEFPHATCPGPASVLTAGRRRYTLAMSRNSRVDACGGHCCIERLGDLKAENLPARARV
jgi:hypothetical protein